MDYLRCAGRSLQTTGINGVGLVKDNLERLAGKKIIVFIVGVSPSRKGLIEEVRDANFTLVQREGIAFFYLRGGFDYSKLDLANKVMMTLLWVRLSLKSGRTPDEKGMLAAFDKPLDCTRRENIAELGVRQIARCLAFGELDGNGHLNYGARIL